MIPDSLSEKRKENMELTPEQEETIRTIMAEMDCSIGFPCFKSGFEELTPVRIISDNAIECLRPRASCCQMALRFGSNFPFCKCPLRKYLALELGR
jgi:hypothetical protein